MIINFRDGDPWNLGANISFTSDPQEVHWAHFIGRSRYGEVGLYEGALNYGKGVWRPEQTSCMKDNSPFFNAPSRESIVRRIMDISGEGFDYDTFYRKDVIPVTTRVMRSSSPKLPLSLPLFEWN